MSQEIITIIEIANPPERVWDALIAFDKWPAWHPSISEFTGRAEPGQRLRFRARSPEGGGAVTLKPTVRNADPGQLLRWRGHFLMPGLFDATHEFVLEPTALGTQVTQRERFTGVLVPLMRKVLARTERDNDRADRALKTWVETPSAQAR
jgi:hypothetical protein